MSRAPSHPQKTSASSAFQGFVFDFIRVYSRSLRLNSQLFHFFVVILPVKDVPFLGAFDDGAALGFDFMAGGLVELNRTPCRFGEKHLRSGDRRHGSESRVTELIQPLSDVGPVRHVPAQPRTSAHPPSFSELVYARHDWWHARQAGTLDPSDTAAYDSVLTDFQSTHGQIVRAYWCSHVESAAALTEQRRRSRPPVLSFHLETDWATRGHPDIASELHRRDELERVHVRRDNVRPVRTPRDVLASILIEFFL